MIKKDNFFKNYFNKSKKFKKNLVKTQKIFELFLKEIKNEKIPLMASYKKDYKFDFLRSTIKKFSKYENIIIIGMGGSALGAKSIYSFFKERIKKKFIFFDNLDLNLVSEYKKLKKLKNSCFIVISKSGNTIETLTNLGVIFSNSLMKNKLIIITEIADNALINIANKYHAEIIEHKKFIGGRYSVLSETGMVPAALMGLNLIKFKNLEKLVKNKKFISSLTHNVAGIYTLGSKGVNNSILLNYSSNLNDLSYWYQQLTAESLGKSGKGISPSVSSGPKDQHSLLQLYLDGPKDKFFTFFNSIENKRKFKISNLFIPSSMKYLKDKNLKFIIDMQCKAVKNVFKKNKIPYREVFFKMRNESELGEIFTFFVMETILLAKLMNINPFDQLAVEQVKIETKKLLT